jgi:prophage regulatory protein
MNRLLRIGEVVKVAGMPRSSIYALVATGQFPGPLKISTRSSAWRLDEIEAWIAERTAARDGGRR